MTHENSTPLFSVGFLIRIDLRHRKLMTQAPSEDLPDPVEQLKKILAIEKDEEIAPKDSFIWQKVTHDELYFNHLLKNGNHDFINILKSTIIEMLSGENADFFIPFTEQVIYSIAEYAIDEASFANVRQILDKIFEKHPEYLLQLPNQTHNEMPVHFALIKENFYMIKYCLDKFHDVYPNLPEEIKKDAFIEMFIVTIGENKTSLYDKALKNKASNDILKLLYQYLAILFSDKLSEDDIDKELQKLYPGRVQLLTNPKIFKDYVHQISESSSGGVITKNKPYLSAVLHQLIAFHLTSNVTRSKKYAVMLLQITAHADNAQSYLKAVSAYNSEVRQCVADFLANKQREIEDIEARSPKSILRNFLSVFKIDNSLVGRCYHYTMTAMDLVGYTLWGYYTGVLVKQNEALRRYLKQKYPELMCDFDINNDCRNLSWHCEKLPYTFDPYVDSHDEIFRSKYEQCNSTYIKSSFSITALILLGLPLAFFTVAEWRRLSFGPGMYSHFILQKLIVKPILKFLSGDTSLEGKAILIKMLNELLENMQDCFKNDIAQSEFKESLALLAQPIEMITRKQLIEAIIVLNPYLEKYKEYLSWMPDKLKLSEEVQIHVNSLQTTMWSDAREEADNVKPLISDLRNIALKMASS